MVVTAPARHRFTVEEFDRLGVFGEDDRVELIDGEVVDMTPIGARHAASVAYLTNALPPQLAGTAVVWVQNPIQIPDLSEPLPDVAVLRPPVARYAAVKPAPGDVLLVVEVADSSLAHDRERKAPVYAGAGIPECWIVDLTTDAVLVLADPVGGTYRTSVVARPGDVLVPGLLPGVSLAVSEILGAG